jgi:hypothetical protein
MVLYNVLPYKKNMKITVRMTIEDTKCVCRNCKKEFIIPKERMLEDYRQCTFCGSLRWKYKDDIIMERDLEIQKISKRIQKDIDKLKKLQCSVDWAGHTLTVFDDKIIPKKGKLGDGDDYSDAVVFTFNTSRL